MGADEEVSRAVAAGGVLPPDDVVTRARSQGYATQAGLYLPGMSSVAVTISPTLLGSIALAITAPTSRFDLDRLLSPLQHAQLLIREAVVGPR